MDVEAIIDKIRNAEDVTLKPITDIVALKISKGPYDGEPEINLIKAEKITAEYISENYSTLDEFYESLSNQVKESREYKPVQMPFINTIPTVIV